MKVDIELLNKILSDQIQVRIKWITHHEEVKYIPRCEVGSA